MNMGQYLKVFPTPARIKDYTGLKQGNLVILGFSRRTPNGIHHRTGRPAPGTTYWVAQCSCGQKFEITSGNLIHSGTRNCWDCSRRLNEPKRLKSLKENTRQRRLEKSKGICKTCPRAYHKWTLLRNIGKLPEAWLDIEQFVADIGCPINDTIQLHYPDDEELNKENTYWSFSSKATRLFELPDKRQLSMRQLAAELGISRQRVHQKYLEAIKQGVDPVDYIMNKQVRRRKYDKANNKYEALLDGEIHLIKLADPTKARRYTGSLSRWLKAHYPDRTVKFRLLDDTVICKVTKEVETDADNAG